MHYEIKHDQNEQFIDNGDLDIASISESNEVITSIANTYTSINFSNNSTRRENFVKVIELTTIILSDGLFYAFDLTAFLTYILIYNDTITADDLMKILLYTLFSVCFYLFFIFLFSLKIKEINVKAHVEKFILSLLLIFLCFIVLLLYIYFEIQKNYMNETPIKSLV